VADAMFNAGVLLEKGFDGQSADKKKALKYYRQAIDLGVAEAMCNAGVLLEKGFDGQSADKKQALEYYRQAIDLGVVEAMYNIAYLLSEGFDEQPSDKKQAEKYCRMAIDNGFHPAILLLAEILPKDTEEQIQEKENLYKKAVSCNVQNAQLCYAAFLSNLNRFEESKQYSDVMENTDIPVDSQDSQSTSSDEEALVSASPPTPSSIPAAVPATKKAVLKPVKISKADKKLKKALERAKANADIFKIKSASNDKQVQKTYEDVTVVSAPDAMKNITLATELKIKGLITALANGEARGQIHPLKGYDNTYSMKITKGDRLVFELLEGDMEKGVTKIRILIAQTHYEKLENKQTFPTKSVPVEWNE
ncbi:MAG: sel1 repeat family protein, partial [Alphaproteobacteria bacterium]|nr:sel1 repeat family protein [Alphaproteobacteria bacterium]